MIDQRLRLPTYLSVYPHIHSDSPLITITIFAPATCPAFPLAWPCFPIRSASPCPSSCSWHYSRARASPSASATSTRRVRMIPPIRAYLWKAHQCESEQLSLTMLRVRCVACLTLRQEDVEADIARKCGSCVARSADCNSIANTMDMAYRVCTVSRLLQRYFLASPRR